MKSILKMAAVAPVIFLAACSKNAPSLGLNTDMKISQIKFADFSGVSGASIMAVSSFVFVKDNPTTATDTSTLVDTFYIPVTTGYDQTLNFNTPPDMKKLYVHLAFYIGGGTATAATIDNIKIDYNSKAIFNSGALNGGTIDNQTFIVPTQTVSY